jgi:uncharacterized protein YbjT (DUF2867 family)
MYVITGATGHTGSTIAEKLIGAGKKVRVISRNAKHLEKFTQQGAEAFVGDVSDVAAVTKAFSGAEAVYLMIPPSADQADYRAYQERVNDAYAAAVKSNNTKYAVVLSSFGADKAEKTGPVVGLHNLETKLEGVANLNALFLRPGYFMENLLPQIGVINTFGFMAGPVKADLQLPMIATHDIGAVAAEALSKLDFSGKSHRELHGARDLNYDEAAKIIGNGIGKPSLAYQQLPPAQLKPAFIQMGMSASVADLILEMADALNTGHMKMQEPRSAKNTTPTTIEQFVKEAFVPAFRGKAVTA